MLLQRAARMPRHPERLPALLPAPDPTGPHAVQVLRTYGANAPATRSRSRASAASRGHTRRRSASRAA
jgi:hypothetical protein